MRKFLSILLLSVASVAMMAVPARPGIWRLVKLADGNEIRVMLHGDEHLHYWLSADGTAYVPDSSTGYYKSADMAILTRQAAERRIRIARARAKRSARRQAPGETRAQDIFQGKKRGLIILVGFTDKSFSMSAPRNFYTRVANEQNYHEGKFRGSISDYFRAQSGGQFELTFDVVGPVTLPHPYRYYGSHNDARAGEMIHDACELVNDSVNFASYDWDNDGEAEEVFVLYAGHGQADAPDGNDNLIWPHMSTLGDSGYSGFKLDNTIINTYACSCELMYTAQGGDAISGIGTFCHEFSHCMGFPDMYDTAYSGNYGMGSWDLMDMGAYNGNSFIPAGYTGYEKMVCGWTKPVELTADTTVTAMKPLADMGQTYVIYNQAKRDEYYILDNRQPQGFDSALPGHGMIINHIDYNPTYWSYNVVNTTVGDRTYGNRHQRVTIFHADNEDDSRFYNSAGYYSQTTENGDAYPFAGNDSLTNNSFPAATLNNVNSDGAKLMNRGITGIRENGDGTMSFTFRALSQSTGSGNYVPPSVEGALFYESFDGCSGTGGNDNLFKGDVANTEFVPDVAGWSGDHMFGARKCAKFGTSRMAGFVTSPSFEMTGDTLTLSFRAAPWATDTNSMLLSLTGKDAKFVDSNSSDTLLLLKSRSWSTFTLKIVGKGTTKLFFQPGKRFFLDDVLVMNAVKTGISAVSIAPKRDNRVYSISGTYLGTDLSRLPHGIYIVDGKKVVK